MNKRQLTQIFSDDFLKNNSGTRYYRCALQVNPAVYSAKFQDGKTPALSEDEYNRKIVATLLEEKIEVVALTDHNNVGSSESLRKLAQENGIHVFPGFELESHEGVHLLCIFPADTSSDQLKIHLGNCKIPTESANSLKSKCNLPELISIIQDQDRNGIVVLPHVDEENGLLDKANSNRAGLWKNKEILACAINGHLEDTKKRDIGIVNILKNKNNAFRRDASPAENLGMAVLHAKDIKKPENLKEPSATTWIKMSEVSIEALRQAFLDPESRIRRFDQTIEPHEFRIEAIQWEGGFLDEVQIALNENLNILSGGRGSGKSTIIESIRYLFNSKVELKEIAKAHSSMIEKTLESDGKITALVSTGTQREHRYRLEREFNKSPMVFDMDGNRLNLQPLDILPEIEIFGQHELSELSKDRIKLTRLVDRYSGGDLDLLTKKEQVRKKLIENRENILGLISEMEELEAALLKLPVLEEENKKFKKNKTDEKLQKETLYIQEEKVWEDLDEAIESMDEIASGISDLSQLDLDFLSDKAIKGLPSHSKFKLVFKKINEVESKFKKYSAEIHAILANLKKDVGKEKQDWIKVKEVDIEGLEKILKDLKSKGIYGHNFIKVSRQIEALKKTKTKFESKSKNLEALKKNRIALRQEWFRVLEEIYKKKQSAAKSIHKTIPHVRASIEFDPVKESLFEVIRNYVSGNISTFRTKLEAIEVLSLFDLADTIRSGADELVKNYGISKSAASSIAAGGEMLAMRIEEVELDIATKIELNTGLNDKPVWKDLDVLSTGQKATALLLMVLHRSKFPLLIDQPEDDLDNSFITEGIIPVLRKEKNLRQFIMATHNANIPVLGDAELIIGLEANGEAESEGKTRIPDDWRGSIDRQGVRNLIERILEGGREAFMRRKSRYGY